MSYSPAMPTVLDPRIYWHCNACGADHVTSRAEPHTPLHPCWAMKGLMVPFVPKGQRAEMKQVEREDYVGKDIVDFTDGKVVMAVVTEHEDGHTDCTIYAPCSTAAFEGFRPGGAINTTAEAAVVAGEAND